MQTRIDENLSNNIQVISDKELVARIGEEVVCDIETYPNYFLICFKFISDGSKLYFEGTCFNKKKLKWVLNNFTIITFNGISFDVPVMLYALQYDFTEKEIFDVAMDIIDGMTPYNFYKDHNINYSSYGPITHWDLKEPAFGKASLKLYAGRLHAPFMQDLPYKEGSYLNQIQKDQVKLYCFNDLDNTIILRNDLKNQLLLRKDMSAKYSSNLMSKSDAQIAEAVISRELKWKYGIEAKRPKLTGVNNSISYQMPDFIQYETPVLQELKQKITETSFEVTEDGKVRIPNSIKQLHLKIGSSVYKMGIGGLHSSEKAIVHESNDEYIFIDADVTSYYPNIIINQKLYPKHLTKNFIDIYKGIVDRRIEAKRMAKQIDAEMHEFPERRAQLEGLYKEYKSTEASLKITINGSFGKFGSPYSILYAPHLLIQTTITGQLCLLMLIEMLERKGFSVVSANTDGIIAKVEHKRREQYDAIVSEWEKRTSFSTEKTEYSKVCSRDVNNYIAVKTNGDVKTKGCFAGSAISKNPSGQIIYEAVRDFVSRGTPIEDTIRSCTDIRKFVFVRTVKGGASFAGEPIGKVVRWYMKKGEFGNIKYITNNNKVPQTDGAYPMMRLTESVPHDIDYTFYIYQANKMIRDNFEDKPEQLELF